MHVTVSTKSDAWDAMSSTVAQYSKGGQTETETEDPSTHSDQRTTCPLGSESSCSSQISFFITSKYMLYYKMMLFEKKIHCLGKNTLKLKKKKRTKLTHHTYTL